MPLVTITADVGHQSYLWAGVKGRVLSSLADCRIEEITASLPPFNLTQAVYLFKQSFRHFPPETFHFVLTDLYAHNSRYLLYAFEYGHHIFCADNGFMTMLFDDKPIQLYRIDEIVQPYNLFTVTDAFIATVTSLLQRNPVGLINIPVTDIMVKHPAYASYRNNVLEAQVIFIDPFGNVVLNVTQQQFEEARQGRNFRIIFMRDEEINRISRHYNDVAEGEKLCLFNTAGYLELAVNRGHAASLFGFKQNNDRSLFYNTIKLFFE